MSFLFRCARHRTELASPRVDQRLIHLEQEVIRLHTEIESLKQQVVSANENLDKAHVGASSSCLIPALPSAHVSLSESDKKKAFTPPILLFPTKPHETPRELSPVPLPPLAPPFTPINPSISSSNSSIFSPVPSIQNNSALSPDGQISTDSLVSALDSVIVTIHPPPPAKSPAVPTSSVSAVSSIVSSSRSTRRALRPLTPSVNLPGLNPAELTNVTLRKPRSAKKTIENGITLDAILNVKLRAANRTQRKSRVPSHRKRGRREYSPSDKENMPVESFFKEALKKKFKRLRELEQQDEADDVQWQLN